MRLARTNLLLAGALVALFALHLATRPADALRRGESAALFPYLSPEDVAGIVIQGRAVGAEPLVVARTAAGGWVLPALGDFPAAGWAADEALVHLARIGAAERISTGGGEEFGLADASAVTVEVLERGGGVLAAFDQAAASGTVRTGRATGSVIRARGRSSVYRAPLVPPLEADPRAWLELSLARLADARAFDATRILVESAGAPTIEIVRDDAGAPWRRSAPSEGRAPPLAVDRLIAAFDRLRLSEWVAQAELEEHGFAEPAMRVELALPDADGGIRNVVWSFAGNARDGYLASARSREAPWVVHLAGGALAELRAAVDDIARGR